MNKEQLIALFNREQRIDTIIAGYRREEAGQVIRQVSITGGEGFVIYSALSAETVQEAIREQLSYFEQLDQRFEWKLYDYDQPANLKDKLLEHGFTIGEPEGLMVMQLTEGDFMLSCEIPAHIIRITDEAGINDIVLLEEDIWGESHRELGEELIRNLENDPDSLFIYAAYVDGIAVSAAWMYLHKGTSFGSLWGGSTLSQYRNKGLYTSLLAVRAQAAWENGFRLLTVDASPMSLPILRKRGFDLLAYSYPCVSPK
ncbi:N-acetyltransferase [Bacillus sp. FJAT-28004]|uniref:N-acetyltransferase n=1 Tax=Bacillus sp. FJAT-28004 TaxID=1679165 RepID=UPI0006B4EC30|nr:N-acetyltransferase [Bacillus sp. FJAT-28004]